MFTWIQKYFQRHFGIICFLILGAMGIPLIVVFAPSDGIGQGDQKAFVREVFGYNLGSQQDQARLFGDANLSATLQLGYAGVSGEQLQQYAFQRAAALHLADERNIPATTPAEITEAIKEMRVFRNEDGKFDAQRYATFRETLKTGTRMTEADVTRVIADDVRAEKLRTILAGPGYVLDADVAAQLARIETTWTLSIAEADYKKFNPSIEAGSDVLAKFFGDNTFRYEIGPRVRLRYIDFPAAKYLDQVTTNEDELKAFFEANPLRFEKPAEGDTPAGPATSADFEIVRAEVEAQLKLAKARELATHEASDLTLAFYQNAQKGTLFNDEAVIDSFLAANNFSTKPLTSFTIEEGPSELGNSADVTNAAFKLGERRFYSDAIPVQNGAVILLWQEVLPNRMPLMSEVLKKVTADYTETEKRKRFVASGKIIQTTLASRLEAGDDFATAAQTASNTTGVTVDVKSLSPFTASNPPEASEFSTYGPLETLKKGQVSAMIIKDQKGVLVYAADKQLPDLTAANPLYQQTRKQIAITTSRLGVSKYLEQLVRQELEKSMPPVN
jgi:peptidyl-prolyl cis-trans isomerase D